MKQISVLMADDHAVIRNGLRTLLEAEGDFEIVGEAKDGREAVKLTRKFRPAVVVMDIAMPELNGLEATRIILKTLPRTKVIILSVHSDDAYVGRAVELGAVGYLLKQSSTPLLAQAIRDVQNGRIVFSPSLGKGLRKHRPKNGETRRRGEKGQGQRAKRNGRGAKGEGRGGEVISQR